jgi:hypothetical protein
MNQKRKKRDVYWVEWRGASLIAKEEEKMPKNKQQEGRLIESISGCDKHIFGMMGHV